MATVLINRAPVLTLWSVIVAQRLGFDRDEALTIGKALAGLTAHAKGTRLGIFEPTPEAVKELRAQRRADAGVFPVAFMGRPVPVIPTANGLRAVSHDKPIDPASVDRYLASKFGDALNDVCQAMQDLAASRPPSTLASQAFDLYMAFRPDVAGGQRGWGAKGGLSLDLVRELVHQPRPGAGSP